MSDPYGKPQKLIRDAAVGMVARLCYLLSRVAMAPMVLSFITIRELGIWSLCFAILSYVALGGFGLHSAYIQLTSRFHAADDFQAIRKLLGTGIALTTALGIPALGIMYLLLPNLLNWFNVEATLAHTAEVLILGTTLCFLLDMTLGGFRSALEGFHEISLVKKVQTLVAFLEFLLIFAFLKLGSGLFGLLYAYALRILTEGLCFAVLLCKCMGRPLSLCWDREILRELLGFGGQVQVSGAMAMITSSLDRIWITSMVGLQATGLFELARKFPFTAKSLSGAAFGSFLPLAARLSSGEQPKQELRRLYLGGMRHIALLNACLFTFLVAVQGPLIQVWLGFESEEIALVMGFLAVAYCLQQLTGPATLVFRGMKQVSREWWFVVPHFLFLLLGLPLGIAYGGTVGAAIAILVGTLLATALFLHRANHSFDVTWSELAQKVLLPSCAPILPAVLVWTVMAVFPSDHRWTLLMGLFSCGLLYTAATLAIYWTQVLDNDEKHTLKAMLQKAGNYVKA